MIVVGGKTGRGLHQYAHSDHPLFPLQTPTQQTTPTHSVEPSTPSTAESVPDAMSFILSVLGNRYCADCSSTGELQLELLHLFCQYNVVHVSMSLMWNWLRGGQSSIFTKTLMIKRLCANVYV